MVVGVVGVIVGFKSLIVRVFCVCDLVEVGFMDVVGDVFYVDWVEDVFFDEFFWLGF